MTNITKKLSSLYTALDMHPEGNEILLERKEENETNHLLRLTSEGPEIIADLQDKKVYMASYSPHGKIAYITGNSYLFLINDGEHEFIGPAEKHVWSREGDILAIKNKRNAYVLDQDGKAYQRLVLPYQIPHIEDIAFRGNDKIMIICHMVDDKGQRFFGSRYNLDLVTGIDHLEIEGSRSMKSYNTGMSVSPDCRKEVQIHFYENQLMLSYGFPKPSTDQIKSDVVWAPSSDEFCYLGTDNIMHSIKDGLGKRDFVTKYPAHPVRWR